MTERLSAAEPTAGQVCPAAGDTVGSVERASLSSDSCILVGKGRQATDRRLLIVTRSLAGVNTLEESGCGAGGAHIPWGDVAAET